MLLSCRPRAPVASARSNEPVVAGRLAAIVRPYYFEIAEIDEDGEETVVFDGGGANAEQVSDDDETDGGEAGVEVEVDDEVTGEEIGVEVGEKDEADDDDCGGGGASSGSADDDGDGAFRDAVSDILASTAACRTRCLLAATLDASSDAALLVNRISGEVPHGNEAAREMLLRSEMAADDVRGDGGDWNEHLLLLLSLPELGSTWTEASERLLASTTAPETEKRRRPRTFDASPRKSENGRVRVASSPPSLLARFADLGECPCCGAQYLCAYLRSKREGVVARDNGKDGENENESDVDDLLYVGTANRLRRVRAALDAAFDPMFTADQTGVILLANAAAAAQFGYSFDEFIGMNVSKLCGGEEHGPRHWRYMKQYLRTGKKRIIGKRREVPARRKDGSEFVAELGISEICNDNDEGSIPTTMFCAYLRDLTEQKEQQREVKREHELAQGMIDASFDPMFQIDSRGTITMANRAATALFGWSREEFLGRNVSMLCGDEHAARHDGYLARYLKTSDKRIIGRRREVTAKCKDGREVPIELGVSEVREPATGESVFCGFVHDLTRRKLDQKYIRKNEALVRNDFFNGADDGGAKARGLEELDAVRPLNQRYAGIAARTNRTEETGGTDTIWLGPGFQSDFRGLIQVRHEKLQSMSCTGSGVRSKGKTSTAITVKDKTLAKRNSDYIDMVLMNAPKMLLCPELLHKGWFMRQRMPPRNMEGSV